MHPFLLVIFLSLLALFVPLCSGQYVLGTEAIGTGLTSGVTVSWNIQNYLVPDDTAVLYFHISNISLSDPIDQVNQFEAGTMDDISYVPALSPLACKAAIATPDQNGTQTIACNGIKPVDSPLFLYTGLEWGEMQWTVSNPIELNVTYPSIVVEQLRLDSYTDINLKVSVTDEAIEQFNWVVLRTDNPIPYSYEMVTNPILINSTCDGYSEGVSLSTTATNVFLYCNDGLFPSSLEFSQSFYLYFAYSNFGADFVNGVLGPITFNVEELSINLLETMDLTPKDFRLSFSRNIFADQLAYIVVDSTQQQDLPSAQNVFEQSELTAYIDSGAMSVESAQGASSETTSVSFQATITTINRPLYFYVVGSDSTNTIFSYSNNFLVLDNFGCEVSHFSQSYISNIQTPNVADGTVVTWIPMVVEGPMDEICDPATLSQQCVDGTLNYPTCYPIGDISVGPLSGTEVDEYQYQVVSQIVELQAEQGSGALLPADIVLEVIISDPSEISASLQYIRFNSLPSEAQFVTFTGLPDGVSDGDKVVNISYALAEDQMQPWMTSLLSKSVTSPVQITNRDVNWLSFHQVLPSTVPLLPQTGSDSFITIIGKNFCQKVNQSYDTNCPVAYNSSASINLDHCWIDMINLQVDDVQINFTAADSVVFCSQTALIFAAPNFTDLEYSGNHAQSWKNKYGSINLIDKEGYRFSCPGTAIQTDLALKNSQVTTCDKQNRLYISDDCATGFYGTSGSCNSCPNGASCPGGPRIWSKSGYWNPNELSAPSACDPSEACLGGAPPIECKEGYAGEYCGECAEDYYHSGRVCVSCGESTADEEAELTALLVAAFAFFALLGLFIFFAPDGTLITTGFRLWAFQQVVQIGVMSAEDLPGIFQDVFDSLALFTFDYTFIRPGCRSSHFDLESLFYANFIVVCIIWISFAIASYTRSRLLIIAASSLTPCIRQISDSAHVINAKNPLANTSDKNYKASFAHAPLPSSATGKAAVAVAKNAEHAESKDNERYHELDDKKDSATDENKPVPAYQPKIEDDDYDDDNPAGNELEGFAYPAVPLGDLQFQGVPYEEIVFDGSSWRVIEEARSKLFKRRLILSTLILFCIVYLKMSVRILEALYCTEFADLSWRLSLDKTVICYSEDHQFVFFAWVALILFVIGFPILCVIIIHRSYSLVGGYEKGSRLASFGFLYHNLSDKVPYFGIRHFLTSFIYAVHNTLGSAVAIKLLVSNCIHLAFFLIILATHPYKTVFKNVMTAIASFGQVLWGVFLLIVSIIFSQNLDVTSAVCLGIFTLMLIVSGYLAKQYNDKHQAVQTLRQSSTRNRRSNQTSLRSSSQMSINRTSSLQPYQRQIDNNKQNQRTSGQDIELDDLGFVVNPLATIQDDEDDVQTI